MDTDWCGVVMSRSSDDISVYLDKIVKNLHRDIIYAYKTQLEACSNARWAMVAFFSCMVGAVIAGAVVVRMVF